MHLQLYQIITILLSGIMIFKSLRRFAKREKSYTIVKLGINLIVWGGLTIVMLYPDETTTQAANLLGIEGTLNALILIGFITLLLMIFKLLSAVEKIEKEVTLITRQEALREIKKPAKH